MSKRFSALSLALATLVAIAEVSAQYAEGLQKKVLSNLSESSSGWRALKYPTDNFGIGTMYDDKGDQGFLCATATCLGISSPWDTTGLKSFVSTGTGGAVTLTDTEKRNLVIEGLIPKILSLASLGGSFNKSSVVVTSLTITSADLRKLERDPVLKRIQALDPNTSAVKRAFDGGKLRVVVADIVLNGLEASIKLDKSLDAGLVAKLEKIAAAGGTDAGAATAATTAVASAATQKPAPEANKAKPEDKDKQAKPEAAGKLSEPGFGISVKRGNEGEYSLKTTRPVVSAILLKKQPAKGALSGQTWNNWDNDLALPLNWAPPSK